MTETGLYIRGNSNTEKFFNSDKERINSPFDLEKNEVFWQRPDQWDSTKKNHQMSSYFRKGQYGWGSYNLGDGSAGTSSSLFNLSIDEDIPLACIISSNPDQSSLHLLNISPDAKKIMRSMSNNDSEKGTFFIQKMDYTNLTTTDYQLKNIYSEIVNKDDIYGPVIWSRDSLKTIFSRNNRLNIYIFQDKDVVKNEIVSLTGNIFYDLSLDGRLLVIVNNTQELDWFEWDDNTNKFVKIDEKPIELNTIGNISGIKISPDNTILVLLTANKSIHIFKRENLSGQYKFIQTISTDIYSNSPFNIYIHPNNKHLLLVDYKSYNNYITQYIWDDEFNVYRFCKETLSKELFGEVVTILTPSPKFKDLLYPYGNSERIYDINDEGDLFCITPFWGANDLVTKDKVNYDIAISPDAEYAAIALKEGVKLYKYNVLHNDYIDMLKISFPPGTVYACDFSRDNQYFAIGTSSTPFIHIYKIENNHFIKLNNIPAATTQIKCLKFTEGNRILCSLSASPYLEWYYPFSPIEFRKGDAVTTIKSLITNWVITKDGRNIIISCNAGLERYTWENDKYVKNNNFPAIRGNAMIFNEEETKLYIVGDNYDPLRLLHFKNDSFNIGEVVADVNEQWSIGEFANVNGQLIGVRISYQGRNYNPIIVLDTFEKDNVDYIVSVPMQPWGYYSTTTYGDNKYRIVYKKIGGVDKLFILTRMTIGQFELRKRYQKDQYSLREKLYSSHALCIPSKNAKKGEEINIYKYKLK